MRTSTKWRYCLRRPWEVRREHRYVVPRSQRFLRGIKGVKATRGSTSSLGAFLLCEGCCARDGNSLTQASTLADDPTSSFASSLAPSPSRGEATSKQSVRTQNQNTSTRDGSLPRSHRLRLLWTRLAPKFITRGRSDEDRKEA